MRQLGVIFGLCALLGIGCQASAKNSELMLQPIKIAYGKYSYETDILCAPKLFKSIHEPSLAGRKVRTEKNGMAPIAQWLSFEADKGYIFARIVCDGQYFEYQDPITYKSSSSEIEPGSQLANFTLVYWTDDFENPRVFKHLGDKQLAKKEPGKLKISYGPPKKYSGSAKGFIDDAIVTIKQLKAVNWLRLRYNKDVSFSNKSKRIVKLDKSLPALESLSYGTNAILVNCPEGHFEQNLKWEDTVHQNKYHPVGAELIEESLYFRGCSFVGTKKVDSYYNDSLTVIDQYGKRHDFELTEKHIPTLNIMMHYPEDKFYQDMSDAGYDDIIRGE